MNTRNISVDCAGCIVPDTCRERSGARYGPRSVRGKGTIPDPREPEVRPLRHSQLLHLQPGPLCDCDVMRGDSISTPLSYDSKNICNVNEQGRTNGFMVSTFSLPADTIYPRGREALYTCPGEANKGSGGFAAKGSYGQCDGGICFTSTTNRTFPGFWNWLVNDIICACPFSTICDPSSGTPSGYQISGSYAHGCDPRDCGKCGAGSLDRNKGQCTGNPLANIPEGTIIPVGAPFGTAIDLSCALLNGNVPKLNSCLCQCLEKDQDGNCVWSVIYQSPLIPIARADTGLDIGSFPPAKSAA